MTTPDSARRYYLVLVALAWSEFKRARRLQVLIFGIVTVALALTWRDVQALKRLEIAALANVIAFALLLFWDVVRAPWIFQQRQAQAPHDAGENPWAAKYNRAVELLQKYNKEISKLLRCISDRDERIRVLEGRPTPQRSLAFKLDPTKIRASLNTPCPHCGHSITPEERTHVDTEHLECRQCKKRFIRGKPAAQSPAKS